MTIGTNGKSTLENRIRSASPNLRWLMDMMQLMNVNSVKVPKEFHEQVEAVSSVIKSDASGLVNTVLDFCINAASKGYSIETDNENLNETLKKWLNSINSSLRGKIPTGFESLAKQYFRERWKGSSLIVMRTLWEDVDGFILPTKIWFVQGGDIAITEPESLTKNIGEEQYYIMVREDRSKDVPIPVSKNEELFVQKPFESWSTTYPTPYLIAKGIYKNAKMIELLADKGADTVSKSIEYLLLLKKGTEDLAKLNLPDFIYSADELTSINEHFRALIEARKHENGVPTYTANFDTELQHIIPEYEKILKPILYTSMERRLLAGLGLVDIVQGISSTRKESTLNPKPLQKEVESGVDDLKALMQDLVDVILEKNKTTHRKYAKVTATVRTSPLKDFITQDVKTLIRSAYDRGLISKQTACELVPEVNFDIEVKRRKQEKKNKLEDIMYPPVIQNIEGTGDPTKEGMPSNQQNNQNNNENKDKTAQNTNTDQQVPNDRSAPPEKTNFKQAMVEGIYKTIKDLPNNIKNPLPKSAQSLWLNTFNAVLKDTGDEDKARQAAWSNVKNHYKKSGDKWVKKTS